jgi:APA family basic amino acid/polyamine antiporter
MKIFRKKSIEEIIANAKKNPLKRTLGVFDLVMIGVGCAIGMGVFVITGIVAAKYAGPAVSLSYFIAAVVCILAALTYAEFASMVPVSGSAYTYSYALMGEFLAWVVGWGLVLEYGIGASVVGSGWSGYVVGILKTIGYIVPEHFTKSPADGGIINIPAMAIIFFIGVLVYRGTKESVMLNRILVGIKLTVIFIFLIIAAPMVQTSNWSNFMPFGFQGVLVGAAIVFNAYIGFDAVATAAEECKNPGRDLPFGIVGSLVVCMVVYISVALVLTGIADFSTLNNPEPLARALRENGSTVSSALIATGSLAGITSVLLILIYGQSRIFFVMSRDGLIPPIFSKMHKKFDTPNFSVALTTIVSMLVAGLFPLELLSSLTCIGTLFCFIIVAIGVYVLRHTEPNIKRTFKCPAIGIVMPLSVLSCGYLIFTLLPRNGLYFLLWTLAGLVVYFCYGYRKSPLNKHSKTK